MQIKQFEDKNLSHFSYAIMSDCEKKIILIDPSRNPQQYFDYAKENEAQITGVIETHPHADFVSSHLEFHDTTGATIYTSKLVNALYPHQPFDEGETIQLGKIKLSAINTPGHSPDSICIILEHDGKQKAVFTGDTLFIGDCGRPDLRPGDGDALTAAKDLASQMYNSLRKKLMPLNDETIIYPAHGAGTLCGKALSKSSSSTIGEEKKTNWSLKEQSEDEFVKELLNEQPFVPAYFSFDVELNKKGAATFNKNTSAVKIGNLVTHEETESRLNKMYWIVDVRDEVEYKKGHLPHSINLMQETKFETWLGSIIKPNEQFYLAGADEKSLKEIINRTAAIGYEQQVAEAFILQYNEVTQEPIDVEEFKEHTNDYTIIDVRNKSEVKENYIFKNSLSIPLGELRENVKGIPTNKPIVVHCVSGFRSAAGSSLIQSKLNGKAKVFDLGEAVKEFIKSN
jgi:glyoxylase-like metal-dependent hydrolase (beta-lactamase superfamily II)/rhodanese-related sulfurtransferase